MQELKFHKVSNYLPIESLTNWSLVLLTWKKSLN